MQQVTDQTFYDLTITELLNIEKWLMSERSPSKTHEEIDFLELAIKDIRYTIFNKITVLHKNTFGDIANF